MAGQKIPKTQMLGYRPLPEDTPEVISPRGYNLDRVRLQAPMAQAHRHYDVELNFVERGHLVLFTGTSRRRIAAGEVGIFWAACPHQILEVAPDTEFVWVTVLPGRFLSWNLPAPFTRAVLAGEILVDPTPAELSGDAAALRRWLADRAGQRQGLGPESLMAAEVEARVRRFAAAVPATRPAPARRRETSDRALPEKVERMARHLAAHSHEPLTIKEVAAAAGLNPNYAVGCFRRHFGMGLKEYLAHQRIHRAQRLLLTGEQTVLEIAYASGFNSPGRFHEWFRRLHGQSPEQWRKANRPPEMH